MSHDVFISYSAKNKITADAVCAMLELNGIRCWIGPRDVVPGMEWGECVIEAIEQSRIMVLIFTSAANASPQIHKEVERAVNHGVAILPLRVEDVIPARALEYFIGNVHWLDALTPPLEAHLKNLAGTIKMLLARMEPCVAAPVQPAAPTHPESEVSEPAILPEVPLSSPEGASKEAVAFAASQTAGEKPVPAVEPVVEIAALTSSGTMAVDKAPVARVGKLWKIAVPVLLVGLLLAGGLYYRSHRSKRLTDKDTIVLADFANSTGDAIFDDTLKTGLNVSLRQSPFLNVLSDQQVAETLQLMTRPASTKLTPAVTRELCQRAGSRAYIGGTIGSLGSEYVLGLKAVNCQSGDTLAQEQVTAASKEKVLEALGEAASKLRGELGESLATVQKFDVPLEQATTSSLEALKAYSLGAKAEDEKGPAAALHYFQRAIELDPNFVAGYTGVAVEYLNLGQPVRAREYLTKAFQLREHTSEREKLHIAALYYSYVTGELDKAAQTYQEEIESYPRKSRGYHNLGGVYSSLGQYEKAAEMVRQALRLPPDSGLSYGNLAIYSLYLQRFDDARQVIHEAQARKLDNYQLHEVLYELAFLGADSAAMAEQQQWFAGKPEYEYLGLEDASDTEAYAGHVGKARGLTKRAVDSALRTDNKESGATWQANAALREAAFGNPTEARQSAAEALKLAPTSQGAESEAALSFAMAGDTARAESLAQDLGKRFPAGYADAIALAACDSGAIGAG
jgi:tetratricopeptide (TPR) repeat protein